MAHGQPYLTLDLTTGYYYTMANDRTGVPRSRSKKVVDDGAHHLKQYLEEADLSYTEFGEKVGCTKAHVCGLVNRKSKPSLDLAARMEAETSGKIPQSSWSSRARVGA